MSSKGMVYGGSRKQLNSFKGKKAWTLSGNALKSKLFDSFYYFGIFAGVALIAQSLLNLYTLSGFIVMLVGLVLTPLTVLVRESTTKTKIVYTDEKKKSALTKVISLVSSTLGAGLTLGSWLLLFYQQNTNFWMYLLVGLVLSVLARYNLKKNRMMSIIEDYLLYITSFNGVVMASYGVAILLDSWLMGVVLIFAGVFLTPAVVFLREKEVFNRRARNPKRKFFSMVSVTLGIACAVVGLHSLLLGSFLPSLLIIEGFIFILGGGIYSEDRMVMFLRDIV